MLTRKRRERTPSVPFPDVPDEVEIADDTDWFGHVVKPLALPTVPLPLRRQRQRKRRRRNLSPTFPLTPQEQAKVLEIQAWCRDLAKQWTSTQEDLEDAAQEVAVVVMRKIRSGAYDSEKSKLTTFAAMVGPQALNDIFRRRQRKNVKAKGGVEFVQKALPLEPTRMEDAEEAEKYLDRLNTRVRSVMRRHYGIGEPEMTLEEIAEEDGIEVSEVRRTVRAGIEAMRQDGPGGLWDLK